MLLSIDQSLTGTGVCYMASDGRFETFLIKTTPKESWAVRMDRILKFLDDIFNLRTVKMPQPSKVDHVVMESYAFGAKGRVFNLGELGGVIKYHFHKEYAVEIPQILIQWHKMWVAGAGNASKLQVIKALRENYGIDVKNDNIADAVSMALFYKAHLDGNVTDPYKRKLIEKFEKSLGEIK